MHFRELIICFVKDSKEVAVLDFHKKNCIKNAFKFKMLKLAGTCKNKKYIKLNMKS